MVFCLYGVISISLSDFSSLCYFCLLCVWSKVYALYDRYGYEQHEIAILFVAGFGSSMIFGSFVGGMADWGGRRAFVILFSIIYAASCLTKRKS